MVLGPLCSIIYWTGYYFPHKCARYRSNRGCKKILIYLIWIFLLCPISIAIGMALVAVADAVAIVPLYIIGFVVLIKLIIVRCSTMF